MAPCVCDIQLPRQGKGRKLADSKGVPQPGDVIADKYRVEREIGSGGMGTVFEVTHLVTHRRFAIKWLDPALATSAEATQRFIREAQIAGSFDHPNVVEVYDLGILNGAYFMLMELLEGESLAARIVREGPIHPRDAFDVMFPCLKAVAAAHVAGIIHRDLKPANIFLCHATSDSPATVKVLDFGISKLIANSPTVDPMRTKTGAIMGTPHYMAPEQMRGQHIDQRVDIYALGVTLYEVLSGRRPFDANSYPELVLKIVGDPVVPLDRLVPGLPRGLSSVVARAMARDPADRFANVHALLSALAPFRLNQSSAPFMEHTRPFRPEPAPPRPQPRTPLFSESIAEGKTLSTHANSTWPWWSAAGAALALAAVGLLWDRQAEERQVEESMSAASAAEASDGSNGLARERPRHVEVGPRPGEPPPHQQSLIGTPVVDPEVPVIAETEVAETPPLAAFPAGPAPNPAFTDQAAASGGPNGAAAAGPVTPAQVTGTTTSPASGPAPVPSASGVSKPGAAALVLSASTPNATAITSASGAPVPARGALGGSPTGPGVPAASAATAAPGVNAAATAIGANAAAATPATSAPITAQPGAAASAPSVQPPAAAGAASPAAPHPPAQTTVVDREQTPQQMLEELRKLAPREDPNTRSPRARPRMDTTEF